MLGTRERKTVIVVFSMGKREEFGIFNDISDYVTLVQPVDNAVNVNNVLSIIGCWIYYSNYKRTLPLIKTYLDILVSPYKD